MKVADQKLFLPVANRNPTSGYSGEWPRTPRHDGSQPHHQRRQGVLEGDADPSARDATRTVATAAPGIANDGHTATPIAVV